MSLSTLRPKPRRTSVPTCPRRLNSSPAPPLIGSAPCGWPGAAGPAPRATLRAAPRLATPALGANYLYLNAQAVGAIERRASGAGGYALHDFSLSTWVEADTSAAAAALRVTANRPISLRGIESIPL